MKEKNTWNLVGIAWNLGYMIAVPLVGLAFGGRLIDRIFGSTPLFFLLGMLVAIILSTILVYRKISVLIDNESNKPDRHQDGTN